MTSTTDHDDRPAITRRYRSTRRRSRWMAMTAVAVLAVAPLAACGGSDDTDGGAAAASSSDGGTAAGSGDMQALQECLAENGIEMGGPPGQSGEGEQPAAPDQDAMAQVQEACGDLMPEGGPGGAGGPGMGGMGGEEIQAWTECLADNGVEVTQPERGEMPADGEMPDPSDMPEPGAAGGTPFGLDTSDPEVAAAVEACADLQPEMGQPPSDGTAGDGSGSTGNTSSDGDQA